MIISDTDRDRIKFLLQSALDQLDTVEKINFEVRDNFNLSNYLELLVRDKRWEPAVDPFLIADPNSEIDKKSRASGIIHTIISEPITENVNFLDFGCGEGHVVLAAEKAKKAVGYDIAAAWNESSISINQILTTKWEDVKANGPYDIVLIYDVLDHVKDEDTAIECLKSVHEVLKPNGKIFLRCHPWCSRHGTHLYHQINKAFIHLCLDEALLDKMGYKGIHTIKIIHPLNTYARWISASRFKIFSHNVIREVVESFFTESVVANLIKRNWRESDDKELSSGNRFPEYQCQQQFVDYILIK